MSLNRKVFTNIEKNAKERFFKPLPKAQNGMSTPPPGGDDPIDPKELRRQKIINTMQWLKDHPLDSYPEDKIRYFQPAKVQITGRFREDKGDFSRLKFTVPQGGGHTPDSLVDTESDLPMFNIFTIKDSSGNTQYMVDDKEFMDEYAHLYHHGRGRGKQLVIRYGSMPQEADGGTVKPVGGMVGADDPDRFAKLIAGRESLVSNFNALPQATQEARDEYRSKLNEIDMVLSHEFPDQAKAYWSEHGPQAGPTSHRVVLPTGEQTFLKYLEERAEGGSVKQKMFTPKDENSVSLNMKRKLQYAQDGAEAQGGQEQMQQMVAQVQQMLQQAEPQQVIAQLLQAMGDPNAVVQVMAMATQQAPEQIAPAVQEVAQAMSQGGGQGQPQAPQAEPQEEMPGGGIVLPDRKEHSKYITQLRKGGMVDEEKLDKSSIEGYSKSLKNALLTHMYSGYAVNTAMKQFKDIEETGVLPKAAEGYEHNEEDLNKLLQAYGVTREQYDTDPAIKAEIDATGFTGEGRIGDNLSFTPNNNNQNTQSFSHPNAGSSTPQKHYYPGYGPGVPNNPFGYVQQRVGMNPLAQMFGAFQRQPGQVQMRGEGDFANANVQDFLNAIGTTHEITGIDPVYKTNIFGREKKHKPRNIIGQRYTTRRIGAEPEKQFAPINDGLTEEERNARWNEQTGEWEFGPKTTGSQYAETPEIKRMRDQIDAGITDRQARAWNLFQPPATPSNVGPLVGDVEGREQSRQAVAEMMRSGDEKAREAAIAAGLGDKPESEYTDEDWAKWEEAYQYACGGQVKGHVMPKAYDGFEVSQEPTWSFNPSQFAYGLEGTGHAVSNFLDTLNRLKTSEEMAADRSPDAIFQVKPPHSGDEGIYDVNTGRQMANDMGADVLPGTGTDWHGFSKGPRHNFVGDFFQQQQGFMRHGGDVGRNDAAGDILLNDDQIKLLKGLGYDLKRKY